MMRYKLSAPKLRTLLASIAVAYVALFLGLGLLTNALSRTRTTDCHRTDSIVLGIYSIVDRGVARQHTAYIHGVLTYKQYQLAVSEADRIHREITRPHC